MQKIGGLGSIPQEVMEQIAVRADILTLEEELERVRGELKQLSEQAKKDEASVKSVKEKLGTLRTRIDEIKRRGKELKDQKKPLTIERLLERKRSLKKNMENIERVYREREVGRIVFEKLRTRYETELKEVEKALGDERARLREWIKELEEKRLSLKKEMEGLKRKPKKGKEPVEEEKNRETELSRDLKNVKGYLRVLRDMDTLGRSLKG